MVLLMTEKGVPVIGKMNKHLRIWVELDGRETPRTITYWMPIPPPPQKETRRSGLRGSNTPEEKQPPETRGSVYDI